MTAKLSSPGDIARFVEIDLHVANIRRPASLWLHRNCPSEVPSFETSGVKVTPPGQAVILLAGAPLTEGEVAANRDGEIVERSEARACVKLVMARPGYLSVPAGWRR